MIKKLLGIAPRQIAAGRYEPSRLALKLATSAKTNYQPTFYPQAEQADKLKVLMLCTEERYMTMANGKQFCTGNHPVEMLVPMLHLKNAGFEIDIFTATGKSVKIEMWAMPQKDENVKSIYSAYKERFENPQSLADFVKNSLSDSSDYVAIFIPGGHGAMLGLPESDDLNKLIHWSHHKGLFMLTICHGPAALLAANRHNKNGSFLYAGYKLAAFPDAVDQKTPIIGYLPGQLPWKFGEKLQDLGVTIINKKADKTCQIDRKLISAASPQAANQFGKLAATALLKAANKSRS